MRFNVILPLAIAKPAQARVHVLQDSPFLDRLGMNRDAGDLRAVFLHTNFEFTGNVVDLRDGQASIHGAVAGHQDFVPLAAPGGSPTLYLVGNNSVVYNCA